MPTFTRDGEQIFRDEDVLRDEYTPDELLERDEEMADYIEALTPVANGAIPRNIFVYGQTGVGKTAGTRMILDELHADTVNFDDVDLETVWVNCKDLTSFQATGKIINELRDEEIDINGLSRSRVNEMLWDEINNVDGTHAIVVLDEVDALGTDDNLLYQLPRAMSEGNVTETKLGLIGISNNFKFREDLSARVQSTLCEHEIHFTPYKIDQLSTILEDRASKAFHEGAINSDAIKLTAAKVGQNTGSARRALDIISKAGSLARKSSDSAVTTEHIRTATDAVDRSAVKDELRELTLQQKAVLYAVTCLEKEGKTPARRKTIFGYYEMLCENLEMDSLSSRSVHNHLSELKLNAILDAEHNNEGRTGGKHWDYELGVDADIVTDALMADSRVNMVTDDEEETGNKALSEFQ